MYKLERDNVLRREFKHALSIQAKIEHLIGINLKRLDTDCWGF